MTVAYRDREKFRDVDNLLYDLGVRNSREGDLPVIHHGTAEWDAWKKFRKENGCNNRYMDSAKRFTVPTRFPPIDLDDLKSKISEIRKGAKLRT